MINSCFSYLTHFIGDEQLVQASTTKKFMTRVTDVYECTSPIPVPFGSNVSVVFGNMTFQAFDAVSDPGDNSKLINVL